MPAGGKALRSGNIKVAEEEPKLCNKRKGERGVGGEGMHCQEWRPQGDRACRTAGGRHNGIKTARSGQQIKETGPVYGKQHGLLVKFTNIDEKGGRGRVGSKDVCTSRALGRGRK